MCLRTLSPFATVLESWAQEEVGRQHSLPSLKWINVFFHGNKLTSWELVCCKCKFSPRMCIFSAFQHMRHRPKALTRHQCQVLGLPGLYKPEQSQLLFFINPSVSGILLLCCFTKQPTESKTLGHCAPLLTDFAHALPLPDNSYCSCYKTSKTSSFTFLD